MLARVDKALEAARVAIQGRKVLVLGSSPNLVFPKNYDKDWCLITINASGRIAKEYGLGKPDLTLMAASVLLKSTPEFDEVRANLSGLDSNVVLVRFLSGSWLKRAIRTRRAKNTLEACGYEAGGVVGLAPEAWKNVVRQVMGEDDYGISRNISTGVFCLILCVFFGARTITTSGIDPNSTGHAYSNISFEREHKNSDLRVLNLIQERILLEQLI